jgi:hypothetical protein
MSNRSLVALAVALPLLAACGVLPDLSIGAAEGVPPISGSTSVDVPQDFKCGDPITDPNKKYTVTTSGTADACTFTFKQAVVAIKAADYDSRPELKGAQLIDHVDFDVSKLAVKDAATGKALTLNDALKDLNGKAFGATILTKDDLAKAPPFTKTVSGAPIDALKSLVQAKKDIVIPIEVVIVVKLTPAPPAKLELDFDAQPSIAVGF